MKPVILVLLAQAGITAVILLIVWHLEPTKLKVFAAELLAWSVAAWVLAGITWLAGWQGFAAGSLLAMLWVELCGARRR